MTASSNQNPEQKARDTIDEMLIGAGWVIQDKKKINLNASLGVAVREYQTSEGIADYVLFVALSRDTCKIMPHLPLPFPLTEFQALEKLL